MIYEPKGKPRFSHQEAGLRRALYDWQGTGMFAWEAGSAKTCVTLDTLCCIALSRAARGESETRVLVVAPRVACDTWVMQAEEVVHDSLDLTSLVVKGTTLEKAAQIQALAGKPMRGTKPRTPDVAFYRDNGNHRLVLCVVSMDTFSQRRRVSKSKTISDVVAKAIEHYAPVVMVCDEVHLIRNRTSNRSRMIAKVGRYAQHRIGLTGTLVGKNYVDLFAQYRWLDDTILGTRYQDFINRYCIFGGFKDKEIVGYKNLEELQARIAPRTMVVRKADVLDLPPVTEAILPYHLDAKELRAYNQMATEFAAEVEGGYITAANALVKGLRLQQITSGTVTDLDGTQHEIGASRVTAIAEHCSDTLTDEQRIVIFTTQRTEHAAVVKALEAQGDALVLGLTGDSPDPERLAARQLFGSNDPRRIILVAQITVMAESVNELVTASHGIFSSLPFDRTRIIQAIARLDRMGQTKPVTWWFMQAKGTVDEVPYLAYRGTIDMSEALLGYLKTHVQ